MQIGVEAFAFRMRDEPFQIGLVAGASPGTNPDDLALLVGVAEQRLAAFVAEHGGDRHAERLDELRQKLLAAG